MKEVERISLGGYAFTFEKDAATLAQNYLREPYTTEDEDNGQCMRGL